MRFEVCLRDQNWGGRRAVLAAQMVGALLAWQAGAEVRLRNGSGLWAYAAEAQAKPVSFPIVSADALDKQSVTLPAGLEGQVNLLVLSFAPDEQNQVETWTAAAQALQHTNVHFRAYRMPVAERENALFRWWANASLRSDETDPQLWHWVVPLYVDTAEFRSQLGIADEKSVVVLLVDKAGRILWRATGGSTPGSRAGLAAAVGLESGGR